MTKTTQESIQEFKDEFNVNKNWHWDDNWDGELVYLCEALTYCGIVITDIMRKGKMRFSYQKELGRAGVLRNLAIFSETYPNNKILELSFHSRNSQGYIYLDLGKGKKPAYRYGY